MISSLIMMTYDDDKKFEKISVQPCWKIFLAFIVWQKNRLYLSRAKQLLHLKQSAEEKKLSFDAKLERLRIIIQKVLYSALISMVKFFTLKFLVSWLDFFDELKIVVCTIFHNVRSFNWFIVTITDWFPNRLTDNPEGFFQVW